MKPGVELELTLERVADKGRSLANLDGRTVLVAGTVPGDRVRAQVTQRRGRNVEARLLEILDRSPLRADPRCAFFGECGGCRWQNLLYPAQLDMKREQVIDAFFAVGLANEVSVPAVLGADEIYHYRNKMEFSFGAHRWLTPAEIATGQPHDRAFALGMYAPGRYDRVLDLTECHLPPAIGSRVLERVRGLARQAGWLPWDVRTNQGFLRHLVLRTPAHSADVMVNLVTSEFDGERMEQLQHMLRAELPEVTTLLNTINSGVAQVATGESVFTLFGDGVVHDRIDDLTFEIGPQAFFQTNTRQAERLYHVARELGRFQAEDVVFDLFCGLGTITLFLARHVSHAVGIELDRAAIDGARRNAARNGIDNVEFVVGDLGRTFADAPIPRARRPSVVVVDPPRAGLHKNVIHWLRDIRPERIVYVSCNPVTQATDIAALKGYRVQAMQPVDLFPHTDHVENVAVLV